MTNYTRPKGFKNSLTALPLNRQSIALTSNKTLSVAEPLPSGYVRLTGTILWVTPDANTRTLTMPNTAVLDGVKLHIVNVSTSKKFTLKNSLGTTLAVVDHGQSIVAACKDAGSGACTWYIGHMASGGGDDLLNIAAATDLTIAAGAITVTQSAHTIDTEAAAASDDLDTVAGLTAEAFYCFRAKNAARTVVFRHGSGNILMPYGQDVALTEVTDDVWAHSPDGVNLVVDAVCHLIDEATELTISAGGAITARRKFHTLEGAGATDDNLDTISNTQAGAFLVLRGKAGRVFTIRHGAGNIRCPGAQNILLSSAADEVLCWSDGTNVYVMAGTVADPYAFGFGRYVYTSTSLTLNEDATAASDEDPYWQMKGGDAVGAPNDDIVRTRIVQDSSAEIVTLVLARSRNGGGYAEVATAFHLGTSGQVADIDSSILFNSGDGAAARQGSITQIGTSRAMALSGGLITETADVGFIVNYDALATAAEDPYIWLLGGDNIGAPNDDIVRTSLTQASVAETLTLRMERSRNGAAYGEIATVLNLGTIGQVADLDAGFALNSGDGAAARQGTITQVGTDQAMEFSGGLITRTKDLGFGVNSDAVAATPEDPYIVILGGDGTAVPNDDIVKSSFSQDSDLEYVIIKTERARNGGGYAEVATALHIGAPGSVVNVDEAIYLNSSNGGVARQGLITQQGATQTLLLAGGLETATRDLTLTVNADAAAASAENPVFALIGGDGVGAPNDDLVRSRLTQDSLNEYTQFSMMRSRNGAAYADIAPDFEVGLVGMNTVGSLSATLGLNATTAGPAAARAFVTFNAVANSVLWSGPAGFIMGTTGNELHVNPDATAAVAEHPSIAMWGGDAVGAPNDDIVRTVISQDSINEQVTIRQLRSRNGGAFGAIPTDLELGQLGTAAPAGLNPVIGFNGTNSVPAAVRATLTYRGQAGELAASCRFGTDSLNLVCNLDATSATDEDPIVELLGGDGVGAPNNDIIRTRITQDSSLENLSIDIHRSRNGAAYGLIESAYRRQTTVIAGGDGAGKVGDLNTNPVTVITDPGAGLTIIPIAFYVEFAGDTAYDAAGAGNDLVFRYVGGAASEVTLDIDNGNGGAIRLVRAAAGTDYAYILAKTTETIPVANTGIELFVRGADPFGAAGNISIVVRAWYRIVQMPIV